VAVKPSALNSTLKRPTTPIAIRTDIPKLSAIPNKSVDKYQEIVTTKKDDRPKPPDADTAATSKVKLLWPTTQHSITQYYGWKHTGVDLDGDYTDAIYAAEDGTVVEAGWNSGGYGLQVVIDHGNGFKTRYGHSSKLFVKVGDKVTRGETIAMVGTTGRSTGTHLHFEVYLNGKRTNPLAYIR
jgi:murein DD-endopeptidase MepM/ murein hydrolase activator NlpD